MKAAISILLLLLFVCMLPVNAQTKIIDSLKKNILTAKSGDEKIQAIFLLCDERASLNTDTLLAYASTAKEIALQQNNQLNIIKATYYLSAWQLKNSLYDSVILTCNNSILWLKKTTSDKGLLTSFSLLKAGALIRSNRFKEALSFMYDMLHDEEKNADTLTQIKIKTSIGWVNMEMDQNAEALSWFYKAMQTSANPEYLKQYGVLFSNIASTYNNLGNFDSAFYYVEKVIASGRHYEQLGTLANALNIRADIYINTKNNAAAEKDLIEALAIRKQIADPFYIVSDLAQLANFYATNNQQQKGIETAMEGLSIAEKYNLTSKLPILYRALAENYKRKADNANYAATLEKIIVLKDSVYQKNSANALAELQTRYELQKKENLIIQQKFDIKQKNYLFYALLLLLLFASLAGWLLFKGYRRKEKLKLTLQQEEEKIQAAISITRAEENERKRIAADLHDNIGAYASAIRADVENFSDNYTGQSLLLLQNLQQHSLEIINSLRDTIWVLNKENITITGISDRIKTYLNKLQPTYSHIQFHIAEDIRNDVRLSSQHALSIFRIVQEAVHNALKHSKASNINIEIQSAENIKLTIIDDGIGIDDRVNNLTGNGLLNMKARAKEAGMQLDILSLNNKGTNLILTSTTN